MSLTRCGRDLASNWKINIAEDLEDYLDELESISINFDGGCTNLNFAEAALLIQVCFVFTLRVTEAHSSLELSWDLQQEGGVPLPAYLQDAGSTNSERTHSTGSLYRKFRRIAELLCSQPR